ncbi:MAG: RDD family protein [Burkholderiales bacterium]
MRCGAEPGALRNAPFASLTRRALALIYEALLLAAVLFAATLPLVIFFRHAEPALMRPLLRLYALALCGGYFVWQWLRGGQTLPMKTWRIRLVTREGAPLTLRHALVRFVLAATGALLFGAGFLWAFADRERQFLHDRLAGTKIVASA